MKSKRVFVTAALLLLCMITVPSVLFGQQKTGPKYEASTETKLKGTVQEIKEVPGAYEGVHVVFKTSDGPLLVHLAPSEFLEMLGFVPKVGESMTITGSKITTEEGAEVLAKLIEQGDTTITLREPSGKPAWTWMKIKN